MHLPRVVIVGRPNVGKSSLLNLLAGRRVSIVDPTAGVTRDRISVHAAIPSPEYGGEPRYIELVDTGGYGIEDSQNLTAEVERQIARGIADADLILFVIDAQAGIVPLDRTVAEVLRHQARVPVKLVANKVDEGRFEAHGYEAAALGFGEPALVSATTKHNLDDLYDAVREGMQFAVLESRAEAQAAPDPGVLLAVVGKRNAGKSTLVNAIAGDERVIVSDIEGTTRDSVDVLIDYQGEPFTLIDTAGIRKGKSVKQDIEYYSQHRSLRSVRRADVCLLLIDATVPVSQVDGKLANEIVKHERPCVIVVNKWDLAEEQSTQEAYADYLDKSLGVLGYAPIVFTSAKRGEGMPEVLAMAKNLYEQARHRVGTGELNQIIERLQQERGPSTRGGKRARIYYATQVETDPPTIMFSVNHPDVFDNNYQRYLTNRLRDELPYAEVPIRLTFKGRGRSAEE